MTYNPAYTFKSYRRQPPLRAYCSNICTYSPFLRTKKFNDENKAIQLQGPMNKTLGHNLSLRGKRLRTSEKKEIRNIFVFQ